MSRALALLKNHKLVYGQGSYLNIGARGVEGISYQELLVAPFCPRSLQDVLYSVASKLIPFLRGSKDTDVTTADLRRS